MARKTTGARATTDAQRQKKRRAAQRFGLSSKVNIDMARGAERAAEKICDELGEEKARALCAHLAVELGTLKWTTTVKTHGEDYDPKTERYVPQTFVTEVRVRLID